MTYVQMAFKQNNIIKSPWQVPWAGSGGLEFFIKAFNNKGFLEAVRNTVTLNVLDLCGRVPRRF